VNQYFSRVSDLKNMIQKRSQRDLFFSEKNQQMFNNNNVTNV